MAKRQRQPVHSLELPDSNGSNVSAVIGRAAVLQKIEHLIERLVEDGVSQRLDQLVEEFKREPERFLPPYELPAELRDAERKRRPGRPKGSTNSSREWFWELYRGAVDGTAGYPRMERPYAWTTLATRMGISFQRLKRELERYGPPPGYFKPRE